MLQKFFIIINTMLSKCRGDKFRLAFAHQGGLRSLIPSNVNATATQSTLETVKVRLDMKNPVLIGLSPHQHNIYYTVQPYLNLEELTSLLSNDLITNNINSPKTIVFCRRLEEASLLYLALRKALGVSFTYPAGFPDFQKFRIVDMYTRACTVQVKQNILKSFSSLNGILRVVVATTAFGMGIDCSNIRKIIHWRGPGSLEQYVQEIGWAGRDGEQSKAILLYGRKAGQHVGLWNK